MQLTHFTEILLLILKECNSGLLTMNNSNEDNVYETGDNCMGDNYSNSFLPVPRGTQTQYDAIGSLFNNSSTEPLE